MCGGHAFQGRLRKDDIDARMAKALADLPSDLGLEAVDKFSMANLDTVRSKTGFMVGHPFDAHDWLTGTSGIRASHAPVNVTTVC